MNDLAPTSRAATPRRAPGLAAALTALALASVCALAGCSGTPTELWVVVESNIRVGSDARAVPAVLRDVQLDATTAGATTPFWSLRYDLTTGQYALPGHSVIRPARSDEPRAVRVVVTGHLADNTSVSQEALVSFSRGHRLLVRMYLARECLDGRQQVCEAMGRTCGEGGACIEVGRAALPEYGTDAGADGGMDTGNAGDAGDASDASDASDGGLPACVAPANVALSPGIAAPRPVAPMSATVASTRAPTVRWEPAPGTTGTRVEFCADRGCTRLIAAFDGTGSALRPDCELPVGTVWFRLRGRVGAAYGDATSVVWQVRLPRVVPSTMAADTVHGFDTDFNGDGLADVAVSAMVGGNAVLAVHPGRAMQGPDPMATTRTLGSGRPYDRLYVVGDVDGNGFVDLVGVSYTDLAANDLATLHLGGPSGLGAGVPFFTPSLREQFGSSGAGGDFDGDGFADLALGAPGAGTTGTEGKVVVFRGSAAGFEPMPRVVSSGAMQGGQRGAALAGNGDIDGDGRFDLALSAIAEPTGMENGIVEVRSGPPGVSADFGTLTGILPQDRIGRALTLADFTGDGRADLVITTARTPFPTELGAVYLQRSVGRGVETTLNTVLTGDPMTNFGTFATAVGDYDDDGYGDLLVAENAYMTAGRMHLLHGSSTGFSQHESVMADASMQQQMNEQAAATGDLDGDGRSDFVLEVFVNRTAVTLVAFRGGAPLTSLPAPFASYGLFPMVPFAVARPN